MGLKRHVGARVVAQLLGRGVLRADDERGGRYLVLLQQRNAVVEKALLAVVEGEHDAARRQRVGALGKGAHFGVGGVVVVN